MHVRTFHSSSNAIPRQMTQSFLNFRIAHLIFQQHKVFFKNCTSILKYFHRGHTTVRAQKHADRCTATHRPRRRKEARAIVELRTSHCRNRTMTRYRPLVKRKGKKESLEPSTGRRHRVSRNIHLRTVVRRTADPKASRKKRLRRGAPAEKFRKRSLHP